jgi:hypothetical protein
MAAELVQNAHDSIVRRRLEEPGFAGGRIEVTGDPAAGTLTVRRTRGSCELTSGWEHPLVSVDLAEAAGATEAAAAQREVAARLNL